MPFYFKTNRITTTNGSGSTESTHLLFLTVANQISAVVKGIYGSLVHGTAGGAKLRAYRGATAGSGGTSKTPAKSNGSSPAAALTAFDDQTSITPGGTLVNQVTVGLAQTGGQGAWVALEPDDGLYLSPNAGANGNLEIKSIANATSVPLDITVTHSEG